MLSLNHFWALVMHFWVLLLLKLLPCIETCGFPCYTLQHLAPLTGAALAEYFMYGERWCQPVFQGILQNPLLIIVSKVHPLLRVLNHPLFTVKSFVDIWYHFIISRFESTLFYPYLEKVKSVYTLSS